MYDTHSVQIPWTTDISQYKVSMLSMLSMSFQAFTVVQVRYIFAAALKNAEE